MRGRFVTMQSKEALKQPSSKSWGQVTLCYKNKLDMFVERRV